MKKLKLQIATLCIALASVGCHNNDAEYLVATPLREITIIFSTDTGVEDDYIRLIDKGVAASRYAVSYYQDLIYPQTQYEAETALRQWLQTAKSNSLLILATSEYEFIAEGWLKDDTYSHHNILLLESRSELESAKTAIISMYGASYLAGRVAKSLSGQSKAHAVMGNSTDNTVKIAADGFVDGYGSGASSVGLAETNDGYKMSREEAKAKCEQLLDGSDTFIFPLAGGSTFGIFDYVESLSGCYTSGIDVDMSEVSDRVVFSVVKHIDRLIYDYIVAFATTGRIPDDAIYGLESRYIDIVAAPDYDCESAIANNLDDAIAAEKSYYAE